AECLYGLDPIGHVRNSCAGCDGFKNLGDLKARNDRDQHRSIDAAADSLAEARLFEPLPMTLGGPCREAPNRRVDREHQLNDSVLSIWRAHKCEIAKGLFQERFPTSVG